MTTIKPVQLFGVYDAGIDGRGPSSLCSIWSTEAGATTEAGTYRHVSCVLAIEDGRGGAWVIRERLPMPIDANPAATRAALKQAALAKLTADEMAALGL